jgi:UDP-sugar transporter A1/2/3
MSTKSSKKQEKTFSSKKMFLLGLLSIQIGIQPILMGWYARQASNVRLRVGVIEGMKLCLAIFPLIFSGQIRKEMKNWYWRTALKTTALPALIYLLQNYLNQTAVVLLDGVTFNILNQTKIIWTALLVYMMLRQYQSRQQIVALVILCIAAILMTTSDSTTMTTLTSKQKEKSKIDDKNAATNDAAFFTGTYQALIAAILSALAGTVIQKALQNQKRNTYVVTAELSLLGEFTLLTWAWFVPRNTHINPLKVTSNSSSSLWEGWTLMTFLTLLCQATGGVLVGFVIKHCGNLEKSFAVVIGMILTALLEYYFNAKPFGTQGIIAIFMVALSTIIYTKYPPSSVATTSTIFNFSNTSSTSSTVTSEEHDESLLCLLEEEDNSDRKK